MEDAIMLFDGTVVPLSKVSENTLFDPYNSHLLYFDDYTENGIQRMGRVKRFKRGPISYMSIFNSDSNLFEGYYNEEKFWKKNYDSLDYNTSVANMASLGFPFEPGIPFQNYDPNMKVYFCVKWISKDGTNYKLVTHYTYCYYQDVTPTAQLNDFTPTGNILNDPLTTELNTYGNYITDKKVLLPDGTLGNISESVLFDILYVWNEIFSDTSLVSYLTNNELVEPFIHHINLSSRYNSNFGVVDDLYHNLYDGEYFNLLRLRLIELRYWLLNYKEDYSKIEFHEISTIIVNIFPREELSYIPYEVKIELLEKTIAGRFWIKGDWYFNRLNDEEAIVKLVRSFGQTQITEVDDFLDYLNSIQDYSKRKTVYQFLYDRINDAILFQDDGSGNRGQFVKSIYLLWLSSKYNPYHIDQTIAESALGYFNYTPFNAQWEYYDDSIPNISKHVDFEASPMLLNYESNKVLWWYMDNSKFEFYLNKICWSVTDYNKADNWALHGTYDIFQPVAIKMTDDLDTIIRMPVHGVEPGQPVENYISNCIPVFYLMYVDGVGDRSDVKETIGTAVDVITTFTGVGGVLLKLRHLKDISKARLFFTLLTQGDKAAIWKAVCGLANASEAFFGAAGVLAGFYQAGLSSYGPPNPAPVQGDPNYDDYQRWVKLDKWFFAFEMLSLSGDVFARRAFKRASQELSTHIDDLLPTSIHPTQRQAFDELADISTPSDIFFGTFNTDIQTKLNNLPGSTPTIKEQFYFDFKDNPLAISEFENDIDLIDAWKGIQKVPFLRKEVKYLKAFKRFTNKPHEVLHITEIKNTNEATGGFRPIGGHSHKHITNGAYRNPDLPPPTGHTLPTYVKKEKNGHKLYHNIYIVNPNVSNTYKRVGEKTIWNPVWDDDRIKEEMVYAFANKKLTAPTIVGKDVPGYSPPPQYTSIYSSFLTDGTEVEIWVENFRYDPITEVIQENYLSQFKLKLD